MRANARLGLGVASVLGLASAGYALTYGFWPSIEDLFLTLPGVDKAIHFVAGLLLWSAVYWPQRMLLRARSRWMHAATAFVVSTAIILADETSQMFVAQRTVDWQDPVSGLAGSLVAFAFSGLAPLKAAAAAVLGAFTVLAWTVRTTYVENHLFFEGILAERGGRYEEAYDRYLLALEQNPERATIYNSIAWLCLEALNRDFAQALEWATIAAELDPSNSDVLDTLGWAYYKNGNLDLAWEHISAAASRSQNAVIEEHLEIIRAQRAAAEHLDTAAP